MNRIVVAVFLLLVAGCAATQAQTSCIPQSQAALLAAFSDNAGPGSITPQNMRNVICSLSNTSGAPFANAGTFTNTQMNQPFTFTTNGLNYQTEFQKEQSTSNFATDALAAGVAVPAGATVHNSDALAGYVNSSSTTSNAVAVYGQARGLASGALLWGGNFLVDDGGFASTLDTLELDFNSTNAATHGFGLQIVASFSSGTHMNTTGLSVGTTSGASGQWGSSIDIQDGASLIGLTVGSSSTAANSDGQAVFFFVRDASATARSCDMRAVAQTAGADLRIECSGNGNIQLGSGASLSTGTTTDLPLIPTMPGMPTGSVGSVLGAPIVIDSTDNKLCWSSAGGGTWKCVTGS